MGETLLQAYIPLLFWVTMGAVLLRITPAQFPRLLGRSLFWVGVPLEVFVLARHGDFSGSVAIASLSLIAVVTINLVLGGFAWKILQIPRESDGLTRNDSPNPELETTDKTTDKTTHESISFFADDSESVLAESTLAESTLETISATRRRQGSFILAGLLGNTGFVGFALLPLLVPEEHLGAAICYQVANNVLVTSGIGVLLASHFGRPSDLGFGWRQVRDILAVPSLWAFALGAATQTIVLPETIEIGLDRMIWLVIAAALILMGMRLGQVEGWESLKESIVPSLLKILVMPAIAGLGLTAIGVTGYLRLVLVLMAGMPTAFAGLILVEEYEIDAPLMASSILVSTVGLLVTLPIWLGLFGQAI